MQKFVILQYGADAFGFFGQEGSAPISRRTGIFVGFTGCLRVNPADDDETRSLLSGLFLLLPQKRRSRLPLIRIEKNHEPGVRFWSEQMWRCRLPDTISSNAFRIFHALERGVYKAKMTDKKNIQLTLPDGKAS